MTASPVLWNWKEVMFLLGNVRKKKKNRPIVQFNAILHLRDREKTITNDDYSIAATCSRSLSENSFLFVADFLQYNEPVWPLLKWNGCVVPHVSDSPFQGDTHWFNHTFVEPWINSSRTNSICNLAIKQTIRLPQDYLLVIPGNQLRVRLLKYTFFLPPAKNSRDQCYTFPIGLKRSSFALE